MYDIRCKYIHTYISDVNLIIIVLVDLCTVDQDKISKRSYAHSGQLLVLVQDNDTLYCTITSQ